jgi:hypothetical protein
MRTTCFEKRDGFAKLPHKVSQIFTKAFVIQANVEIARRYEMPLSSDNARHFCSLFCINWQVLVLF